MRATSLALALCPISALASNSINITETKDVDLASNIGNLGWGATNLPFGYSAGVGFNFAESTYRPPPFHTQAVTRLFLPPRFLCYRLTTKCR